MDQGARSIVSADYEARRPVCIDVVGTSLGVIFHDEYRGVLPIGARGHLLDQPAESIIIIRNIELRRRLPRPHARRMVVWESHYREIRHGVLTARLERG